MSKFSNGACTASDGKRIGAVYKSMAAGESPGSPDWDLCPAKCIQLAPYCTSFTWGTGGECNLEAANPADLNTMLAAANSGGDSGWAIYHVGVHCQSNCAQVSVNDPTHPAYRCWIATP